jgi:hypothetical protein
MHGMNTKKIFFKAFTPGFEPSKTRVIWVPRAFPWMSSGWIVKLRANFSYRQGYNV